MVESPEECEQVIRPLKPELDSMVAIVSNTRGMSSILAIRKNEARTLCSRPPENLVSI